MAADLKLIMLLSTRGLEDKEPLDSVALSLNGLEVDAMLYTCSMGNAELDDEDELMEELPSDSYNPDELDLEVEECGKGEDIASEFAYFVEENYTDETMIVTYDMKDEMYNELKGKLEEINIAYQITKFDDIFKFMKTNNIPIKELFSKYNINENMLLPDSEISLAYFLGVLINQVYDK